MRGTVLFLLSGLSFGTLVPVSGLAQPAPLAMPSQGTPYDDHIADAAQRFKLPAAWIRAVPSGAAITVSGPLSKTTQPARFAAARAASTLE